MLKKISVLSETSDTTDPRNFNERRGAWNPPGQKNKENPGFSNFTNPYGSGPTLSSFPTGGFGYNAGVGFSNRGLTASGEVPRPQTRPGRTQARPTATSNQGFAQRDKKGKARPVADLGASGAFKQRTVK